jgi:hypothetical protein
VENIMNIEAASSYHQYMVGTVLACFVSAYALSNFPVERSLILLLLWAFNVYCCYRLATAIDKSGMFWGFLGVIGFFCIFVPQLLLLNTANKIFRSAGMKIGFLGGASKP